MKSTFMAVALAVFGTAAAAADFDNNAVTLELYRDNVAYTLGTVAGEATDLGVEVAILPHSIAGATADLTLGAEYGIVDEDFTFSAAYGVSKQFNAVTAYGELEAAYTVASGDTDGVWVATPLVGASYKFNDKVSAFGEVSYSWNASNDWNQEGGLVEVGATLNVQNGFYVRPSLTRSFDTAADETNAALKIGVAF